jgi:hypothetical protein
VESKLRIPRFATAVLVLGGACGDEEKSSRGSDLGTEGTDTSAERQDTIAEQLCKLLIECEGGDAATLLPTCKRNTKLDFADYAETVTDDCMDALLDYYACYASLSCEEADDEDSEAVEQCATETRIDERCEGQLDDV